MSRAALCAAICGLVVASQSPAHAYRTARDLPELSGRVGPGELVRWSSPTFEYYLDLEALRSISYASFQDAAAAGLEPWDGVSCSGVQFRYQGGDGAPMSGDRLNGVGFVSSRWDAFGFPAGALAVTDVVYVETESGWEIAEADIWLNAWDHRWTAFEPTDDARSVQATITHEIGHALGILHPCELDGDPACSEEHEGSTMHPVYGNHTLSLSEDDAAALCLLYPSDAVPCSATCGPAEVCVDGECRSACGECPTGTLCEAGACVPDPTCGAGCLPSAVGDSCGSDEECRSGACRAGLCAARCGPADSCSDGTECVGSVCVGDVGGFGEPCALGEECASGVCLQESGDGYCTRPCADGCPSDTTCEPVSGTTVCVLPSAGAGCSAATSNGSPPVTWLLLMVSLVLGRCTRRKAR